MLESWQLARLDLIHNTLHSRLRRYIGLDRGDTVFASNVFEQLVGARLISHNGEDVSLGLESARDGCDSDVAGGSYNENSLHDLGHIDDGLVGPFAMIDIDGSSLELGLLGFDGFRVC